MECVHFACPGKHLERHHAEARHGFFVDSLYGQVYCAKCADYVYSDDVLEPGMLFSAVAGYQAIGVEFHDIVL